jgi:exopolyphosphatase/guanosine-5'-triphosphate,3'-diphosphate pyrophosphatase
MSKQKHKNEDKSQAATVAAIDIGSNSIRLVVAQVFQDGTFEVLERLQQALKIGQDTFRKGRISAQTMRAAVLILQRFREVLNTYKVEKIRAVATSAVREAANTDNFLDRILIATGLDVKVISAAEESRLNISAVRSVVGKSFLSKRQAIVVEVGGGSTILNLIDKGEIKITQSLAVGSIRLQEVLATSSEPVEQAAKMIDHQVKSAISVISRLLPMKRIRTFIALGGDVRWAAKQVGKSGKFPSITNIQPKNLKSLIQLYQKYSTADLARSLKIPFTDAETLTPALIVYHTLLQSTSAQEIAVCDVSMRDGLLLDFARIVSGKEDESFALQVLNSARAIATKYHVDLGHADHVCRLAVSLYDELKRQQWVSIEYRLLLQAAAILHEVGIFISSRAHHKHSYYIIANSEVFGLESKELEMVAHIARYHRRSRPKASHLDYARLPREQKMVINRLASLLRVADALDVDRTQGVKDFTCRIENDNLIISVTGPTDLSLEKRAMTMKSDLFEEIYGLKVQLEKAE